MSFLKEIDHSKYKIENIVYKTFICDDCNAKNKEYVITTGDDSPKDLTNFGYVALNIYNNPLIYITTPPMVCLFGIDTKMFNMSLQFTNVSGDNIMSSFFDFIKGVEFSQMKYLNLDEDDQDLYLSQIRYDKAKKYDPNLSVKVPFKYNKFDCDIYNENYSSMNIMNINNFTKMRCDIYIDKIWKYNEKFICKWKCKKIHIL
jgi:hypothetical protein